MKQINSSKGLAAAMLALALGFSACGDESMTSAQPEAQDAQSVRAEFLELHTIALPDTAYSTDLRIYKHVHALSHALMEKVERTPTSMRFAKSDDARVAAFKVGDVLVSSYDRGLFRAVTAVQDQGSHVLLLTRQANLEEAIAQGHIHFAKMSNAQQIKDNVGLPKPGDDGLGTIRQPLSGDVQKSWDGLVKYNKDFKGDVNAKLRQWGVPNGVSFTNLSVDVNIGAELEADYDVPLPNVLNTKAGFAAKTNGQAVLNAQLEVDTAEAQFNVEREIYLFSTDASKAPLAKVPAPAPMSLNLPLFPLTINFQAHGKLKTLVALDNGIDGDNAFTATGGAIVTASLDAGLSGGIGRSWDGNFGVTPSVQQVGPEFKGEKNFRAYAQLITSATVEVGEGLSAAATVVPLDAKVYLSQEINADTKYCPSELLVEAKGSATLNPVKIKVKVPILGEKSFDILKDTISKTFYDTTLLDYKNLLDIPEVCDPNAMPPANEQPTGAFGGRRNKCDAEQENACGGASLACFEQSCVTEAPLRISLAWFNSNADLDLIVERPDGSLIYWRERGDRDLGYYDFHSADFGGALFAGRPEVESFFAFNAAPGTYKIYVGRDSTEGVEGTSFKVQAFQGGDVKLDTGGELGTGQGQYKELPAELAGLPSFTFQVK